MNSRSPGLSGGRPSAWPPSVWPPLRVARGRQTLPAALPRYPRSCTHRLRRAGRDDERGRRSCEQCAGRTPLCRPHPCVDRRSHDVWHSRLRHPWVGARDVRRADNNGPSLSHGAAQRRVTRTLRSWSGAQLTELRPMALAWSLLAGSARAMESDPSLQNTGSVPVAAIRAEALLQSLARSWCLVRRVRTSQIAHRTLAAAAGPVPRGFPVRGPAGTGGPLTSSSTAIHAHGPAGVVDLTLTADRGSRRCWHRGGPAVHQDMRRPRTTRRASCKPLRSVLRHPYTCAHAVHWLATSLAFRRSA